MPAKRGGSGVITSVTAAKPVDGVGSFKFVAFLGIYDPRFTRCG